MERSFEYTVLTAIPDERRGERVNIGVAVFRDDAIDVRMMNAVYKLRVLTGENWSDRIERASARYRELFDKDASPAEMLDLYEQVEPLLKPSGLGWLRASSNEEYEAQVKQVLESLVRLPRRARTETKSQLNTKIARAFKKVDILASQDETIDAGRVVRGFTIDESEDLVADFALQNGVLHVVSTLDLKSKYTGKGETALKSMILHKAEKRFPDRVKKIGVFSVEKDTIDTFRPQITMLEEFSDVLLDWQSADDQKRLTKDLIDAMGHRGGLI